MWTSTGWWFSLSLSESGRCARSGRLSSWMGARSCSSDGRRKTGDGERGTGDDWTVDWVIRVKTSRVNSRRVRSLSRTGGVLGCVGGREGTVDEGDGKFQVL